MHCIVEEVTYRPRRGASAVFDGLSIEFKPGLTLLLGENGAGKTTLLKLIAKTLRPQGGRVGVQGRILYLPQRFVAVPGFTCAEYISHLAWLNGRERSDARDGVILALQAVGLEGFEERSCTQLSGGQQARLALAMALNSKPDLLLLDEPGAALDPLSKAGLRELYRRVVDEGIDVIVSSHDAQDLDAQVDSVVLIAEGRVRFQGSAQRFSGEQHADEYVRRFARSMRGRSMRGA